MFVTSPLDLNDPFEMRPGWTDDHEKRFSADQQLQSELITGVPVYVALANDNLKKAGTMPYLHPQQPIQVDSQRGIADRHNSQIFRLLHQRFRVLSLVSNLFNLADGEGESDEHSTLMWSHYADQFQGVCFALDAAQFDNGMRCGGFPVKYFPERQTLPPSYYDCWQSLSQPRDSAHKLDPASGLFLNSDERSASEERHFLNLLVHKSPVWQYEREVRMIYDLARLVSLPQIKVRCEVCNRKERPLTQCNHTSYRDTIHIPPAAVRAVIFGADCPLRVVQSVFDVLSESKYQHVETYWSCLHSSKYLVHYVKGSRDYIECIQQELAKHVAFAKNHYFDGKLRLAPKGINYVRDAPPKHRRTRRDC